MNIESLEAILDRVLKKSSNVSQSSSIKTSKLPNEVSQRGTRNRVFQMNKQIKAFIDLVNKDINVLLRPENLTGYNTANGQSLWEGAQFNVNAGGKRVRPMLVHCFADMVGLDSADARSIAVTAELIHAASLVHDDVIDEAEERRNQICVHKKWDTKTAILCGDIMFALAFSNLAHLRHRVMVTAAEVLREMSCSVIDEFQARDSILDLERWRSIAEGKTGALFAWCGLGPAIESVNTKAEEHFVTVGRHLGVAFQLADDLKDVLPNQGKDRFADLKNANPSFLITKAVAADPHFREEVEAFWATDRSSTTELERLGDRVVTLGFDQAIEALKDEVQLGLDPLRHYSNKASAQQLISWAETNLGTYLNSVAA